MEKEKARGSRREREREKERNVGGETDFRWVESRRKGKHVRSLQSKSRIAAKDVGSDNFPRIRERWIAENV